MSRQEIFVIVLVLLFAGFILYTAKISVESIKNCNFATRMGVCSCNIEDGILQQLQQAQNGQNGALQQQTPTNRK